MGILVTEEATIRLRPNGGVNIPIAMFAESITPKCTGSMPYLAAIGTNKGARITIAGAPSIKQPKINTKKFISNKNINGEFDMPKSTSLKN